MNRRTANDYADYWRYEVGGNVIPATNLTKVPKVSWKDWQTKPIPKDLHEEWKRENMFDDGLAIVCTIVFHNPEHIGKYINAVDCDNKLGIDVLFPEGLERIASETVVEQHANKEKCHIYFYTKEPLASKAPNTDKSKELPMIEVKSGSKFLIYGAGCKHKDGSLIDIIGTDKIATVEKKDIEEQIVTACEKYGIPYLEKEQQDLEPEVLTRSANYSIRKRFKEGKIPTKGTSFAYFYQAAIQCNTDGLSLDEAIEKIQPIYEEWVSSDAYSARPWDGVVGQIKSAYEKDAKLKTGRNNKVKAGIDRTQIADEVLEKKQLYSDVELGSLYENKGGFLENYKNDIGRDLIQDYPQLESADEREVIFKLLRKADPMPEVNDDLIVFKNGVRSLSTREAVETDEIGGMGFKEYDWLPRSEENEPKEFLKFFFSGIPDSERPRAYAGLRAILKSDSEDSRMTILTGGSGSGKTKALEILQHVLGDEYAYTVTITEFLDDHFIKAHAAGKRLLIFQDMPDAYKDYETLKTITGDSKMTVRKIRSDKTTVDNKLKIFGSANTLATIPEQEKNAMYNRRLSLLHKDPPPTPFKDVPSLPRKIAKEEGEKILSWIFNLTDEECQYEDSKVVQKEWEALASPEERYIQENYVLDSSPPGELGIVKLKAEYERKVGKPIELKKWRSCLLAEGYIVRENIVKNLRVKEQPSPETKSVLESYGV